MTFCERLSQLRKANGQTMSDMAGVLGISAPGYRRLEDGTSGKSFEKLPIIAKTLGCRIDDLFPEMDGYDPGGKTVCADGFEDDDSLDCFEAM